LDNDPAANLLTSASEEAQKVARNEGKVRVRQACADSLRMLWLLWQLCLPWPACNVTQQVFHFA